LPCGKTWGMKSRRGTGIVSMAVATAGALLGCCGCGGPPDAGTINMSKAKEVAALRGIAEKKVATVPAKKNTPKSQRLRPTQALPKGGR
jgi:hypothetical protein